MSRTGRPRKMEGTIYQRKNSRFLWVRYRTNEGKVQSESTGETDIEKAARFLRDRLNSRDDGNLSVILASKNLTFNQWADWFMANKSKPPIRAEKTHEQNLNALKLLRPIFGELPISAVTSEAIEEYLQKRLCSGRRVHTKLGMQYRGRLKPATVHQEYRVLRRILNVAVQKKRLSANPCSAVEFPVSVSQSNRKPHYLTASEQARIQFFAPKYLKNAVNILTEMGLRPYKELMPMKKSQVDFDNRLVHIADSKTQNGITDMPMTDLACEAFKAQLTESPGSEYLFPTPQENTKKPYVGSLKKVWATTLRRASVPYFPLYELRHTFATRLSAGGVADHFVTQLLRQRDSQVFKRYSQAKLGMMREGLAKLDRQANEHERTSGTVRTN